MKSSAAHLRDAVLRLPPADRAQVALAAWDSLEGDPGLAESPSFDPEGLALARDRDREIESGLATPLTHAEFRERTGGGGA